MAVLNEAPQEGRRLERISTVHAVEEGGVGVGPSWSERCEGRETGRGMGGGGGVTG